jgi:hypothetical protein
MNSPTVPRRRARRLPAVTLLALVVAALVTAVAAGNSAQWATGLLATAATAGRLTLRGRRRR